MSYCKNKTGKTFSLQGCAILKPAWHILDNWKTTYLTTAWQMSNHCQMNALWTTDNCIWRLPNHWVSTAWRMPDDCLTTAWRLPDDCLTTAWRLPDNCLMNAWRLPDNFLITSWWLPDNCLIRTALTYPSMTIGSMVHKILNILWFAIAFGTTKITEFIHWVYIPWIIIVFDINWIHLKCFHGTPGKKETNWY